MGDRTFTTTEDRRVKQGSFPLDQAIGWYLADYAREVEASTLRRYRGNLANFLLWLPEKDRTLSSITHERVTKWAKSTTHNEHSRMNRIIAVRSFARYLAKEKLWFEGVARQPISVLTGIDQPQPSPKGTPAYRDEEVRTIIQSIPQNRTFHRTTAIIAVELHGLRAKEVRTLLRKNVVFPDRGEALGHFVIDDRRRTKSFSGLREIPMEGLAVDAIRRYVRLERPTFTGSGAEPLFLTEDGQPFTEGGWNDMAKRLKDELAPLHIAFRQHRFRATRASQMHAAGVPDSVIVESLGWGLESGARMLHRYVGQIPLSTLKRATPALLDKLLGRSA